jgi:N-acetyl-D-muramate 6-phosphate phosphatase
MKPIRAVLFDLDGTLLDTAPDLVFALNELRSEQGLPNLTVDSIRQIANLGSKAMVRHALNIDEDAPSFAALREKFLTIYQKHIADSTQFYPNIEKVLSHLDEQNIPWGIVTNKLTKQTLELLKVLRFDHRPGCVICGDSLPTFKPDPAPILHACQLLKHHPADCLYVGDAATDVTASKAAGTKSLVALYGYIHQDEDPYSWKADGYIHEAIEIIDWLASENKPL